MANNNGYTFFNLVEAVGKENKKYLSTTVLSVLTKIESKTAGTKKLVTASMPINGRAKAINARLGTEFGDDETVWVRVQFWEDRAERFMKMLNAIGNPSSVRLVLVGALSVQQYEKDGTVRKNVILNANDWNLVGNSTSNASKPANNAPAQNQSAPAAPAASGFDDGGFADFEEFNGSEDDLPF